MIRSRTHSHLMESGTLGIKVDVIHLLQLRSVHENPTKQDTHEDGIKDKPENTK